MYTWQKFAVTAASLALTFGVVDTRPAEAVNFNFNGKIDSGALSGESFSGSFSYDESLVTGTGIPFLQEFVPVSNLQFDFLSTTFTEANDVFGGPEAAFIGNDLVGLSFNVSNATASSINVNFSFVPGFTDVAEAQITYDSPSFPIGQGEGAGSVTFSGVPEQVPEPLTILGTGVVLGFGALFKKEAAKRGKK